MRRHKTIAVLACLAVVGAGVLPATAAQDPPPFTFGQQGIFGMATSGSDTILVADPEQGIVELTDSRADLKVGFAGLSDVAEAQNGDLLAITGGGAEGDPPSLPAGAASLYRFSGAAAPDLIADLWAFEQANDPDANSPLIQPHFDSNPYAMARVAGATLVADAGANDLLAVADDGSVDWMVALPGQMASTAYLLPYVDCDDPDFGFVCVTPEIPAEPVPTSVAVGPDGKYYVGELTGFPGTPGISRIWRVEPGTRHTVCPGDGCSQVLAAHPFTAVVDLAFGPDGTLYVLEADENGFLALEGGAIPSAGGTLNACHLDDDACVELATGLVLTTTVTVALDGGIYAAENVFIPGLAGVYAVGQEFSDDNGNVHELNIARLAAAGVTRGCNPPTGDQFCPGRDTTRGEMAAFVRRALSLAASTVDAFGDDDGSVFEADINALAAAGITRGCNPPANDRYCPDDVVARGAMAAFLVRALHLPASGGDAFVDDDGSVFEADINALAAAGITKGCNPPANDRYCPDDAVKRDQMASFLVRATDWLAGS